VRRFVLPHPTEIYLRKVDQLWFLDLITNGLVPSKIAHPTEVSIKTLLEPKEGNCRNRLSIRARPGSKTFGRTAANYRLRFFLFLCEGETEWKQQ